MEWSASASPLPVFSTDLKT